MSLLTCMEVSGLLEARASGLGSADAIRVEQHLQTCDDCRETDDYLQAFGALADAVPELDHRRSEWALSAALATIEVNRPVSIPRPRPHGPTDLRRVAAFGAGAATAVTAMVLLFAAELPERRSLAPATQTHHEGLTLVAPRADGSTGGLVSTTARHLQGSLQTAEGTLVRGQGLPAHRTLFASTASQIALPGGFLASLAEGSALQWQPESLSLTLSAGAVRVLGPDGRLLCELGPGERCQLTAGPEALEP